MERFGIRLFFFGVTVSAIVALIGVYVPTTEEVFAGNQCLMFFFYFFFNTFCAHRYRGDIIFTILDVVFLFGK